MEDSYLIQRLCAPIQREGAFGKNNPFAFGGGLKNGGLSDEAMDLLRPIFSFDYMGSSEFEFGAVPKTLQRIAKWAEADKLARWEFSVDLGEVPFPTFAKTEPGEGKTNVYVIARDQHIDEVVARLKKFMTTKPYSEDWPHFKEQPMFGKALHRADDLRPVIGWLELDNGWFAFIEKDAAESVARMFGIE